MNRISAVDGQKVQSHGRSQNIWIFNFYIHRPSRGQPGRCSIKAVLWIVPHNVSLVTSNMNAAIKNCTSFYISDVKRQQGLYVLFKAMDWIQGINMDARNCLERNIGRRIDILFIKS